MIIALFALAGFVDATAAFSDVRSDVVIRGAVIFDGSGAAGKPGDLAIHRDKIVAVGKFRTSGNPRIIDGKGLVAAPGFIDLHSHSDIPLTEAKTKANLSFLYQGTTTVVTGNCGSGPVDVAAFFQTLEKGGIGTNVIHLAPHNDIRRQAMGNANRPPTPAELGQMEKLVDRAMRDGAWGLSTGLIYNPGTYAHTDEIVSLAKVAAGHAGIYASHIRNEGSGLLAALDEALRIGKSAGLPVHISHLKASGRPMWGRAAEAVTLLEGARKQGQRVTADQYPYAASSTSLAATLIPPQFREGTQKEYLKRLDDPEQLQRLRDNLKETLRTRESGSAIRVARCTYRPQWQGKSIQHIALQEKMDPVELVLLIEKKGGAAVVNFNMSEEDVRIIMKQPFIATASDGSSQMPGDTVPHPRSYGCFPRKIGRLAIEEKLVPVEQAIRSASGLPADILKLPGRGYLKPGYIADVVVFDPVRFRDTATFDKPHQFATGVKYLFVNGKPAIDESKPSGILAGRVLRHKSPVEAHPRVSPSSPR